MLEVTVQGRDNHELYHRNLSNVSSPGCVGAVAATVAAVVVAVVVAARLVRRRLARSTSCRRVFFEVTPLLVETRAPLKRESRHMYASCRTYLMQNTMEVTSYNECIRLTWCMNLECGK